MTDQPSPHDKPANDTGGVDHDEENEVLRAARLAKQQQERAAAADKAQKSAGDRARPGWKTAAGIGIGSAALLAALLYARRDKD
ncbi:MAG: hypothetical protein MUF41_04755 [Sphingopyxis sp.]|nr:hypothetical protein [Sphingopyxis sp.]